MPFRAMRLSCVARLKGIATQNVFLTGYSLKVIRVPTIANAAQVVNLKITNRTNKQLVRQAMHKNLATIHANAAVPLPDALPLP